MSGGSGEAGSSGGIGGRTGSGTGASLARRGSGDGAKLMHRLLLTNQPRPAPRVPSGQPWTRSRDLAIGSKAQAA
jgi:hypothetical protein